MMRSATVQPTKVAPWGNSEAVRIPRNMLRAAGLSSGNSVDVTVNERGNIEIMRKGQAHRRVSPARGVTFDALFAGYQPREIPATPAWPDDHMVGAELEAWSQ